MGELMNINRKKFFDGYKEEFGHITKDATLASLTAILDVFSKSDETIRVVEKFAYMMATVKHEVGEDMIPIVENMNYTSIKRIRQVWPSRFPTDASAAPYVRNPELLGNKVYGGRMGNGLLEGYKFRGRGIGCQLTGYDEYKKFGELLGLDIVHNPDLAMDVNVGAQILYKGMIGGLFTGKKLSGCINGNVVDYINARRVVNGDVGLNGVKIVNYAKHFEKIFRQCVDI